MSARLFLTALALLGATASAPAVDPKHETLNGTPVTGKAAPGTEALDKLVVATLSRHGIPGASLAIAKDGKLVVARGYGWANLHTEEVVHPDTLFGVASLSKSFTAVAILKLVEQGKLSLDDHPFKLLAHIKAFPGVKVDPRLYQITVRHLLNHSGGWDHVRSGDPVTWTTQMQLKRGDKKPVSSEYLISESMRLRLDFDPGTDTKYSNLGYIVLGEVVEKASGQPYEKYVKEHVLTPAGAGKATLHQPNAGYFKNEARRYLAGTDNELPPWKQKYSDAAGGWAVSSVDMVRFLTALDSSRGKPLLDDKTFRLMIEVPPKPLGRRENGTHWGLGWDSVALSDKAYGYSKGGNWYGMRAFMKRSTTGVNSALLFNASMMPDAIDGRAIADAVKEVQTHLDQIEKFEATTDLFKVYP